LTERRSLASERLSVNAISNDNLNTFLENGASQEAKLGFLDGVKSAALGSGDDAFFAARMASDVIASPLERRRPGAEVARRAADGGPPEQ
jgi:hypothetical protein